MKKNLYILAVALIFSLPGLAQQPWAHAGATWYYNANSMIPNFAGYVKIEKTGDTLINGINCDMLVRTQYGYDYLFNTWNTLYFGTTYTYENNNVVYQYGNGTFYTLYDFNATTGTTWSLCPWYNVSGACTTPGTTIADSTGTVTISGITLNYFTTTNPLQSNYVLPYRTIERIGNLGYLLPTVMYCMVDADEAWGLRCYFDSTGFYYSTGIVPYCDYTTGINDLAKNNAQLEIAPNPNNGNFLIRIPLSQNNIEHKSASLLLLDVVGRQQKEIPIEQYENTKQIKIQSLANGSYLCVLVIDGYHVAHARVVKE